MIIVIQVFIFFKSKLVQSSRLIFSKSKLVHFQGLGKNASLTTKNRFFKIILHILFQPIHLSSQLSQPAYTCQHFSNCPLALLSLLWSNFWCGNTGMLSFCVSKCFIYMFCVCLRYIVHVY